jgi:hypothetical protein
MADANVETEVVETPVEEGKSNLSEEQLSSLIDEELKEYGYVPPVKEDQAVEEAEEPEPVEEPEIPEETPEELEEAEPETPAPVEPATPTDEELFIEVEDAEGVTHKISKASDLPPDFQFGTEANLLDTLDRLQDLKIKIADREKEQTQAAEAAALEEVKTAQYSSWDSEISELTKSKRLTASDTDKVEAVFGHMNEVNNARIAAGNPNLISSFEDALDKYEAKLAKDDIDAAKKNDNAAAKAKSTLIGKTSAAAGGDRQPYRSGQYRSIDDIPL